MSTNTHTLPIKKKRKERKKTVDNRHEITIKKTLCTKEERRPMVILGLNYTGQKTTESHLK